MNPSPFSLTMSLWFHYHRPTIPARGLQVFRVLVLCRSLLKAGLLDESADRGFTAHGHNMDSVDSALISDGFDDLESDQDPLLLGRFTGLFKPADYLFSDLHSRDFTLQILRRAKTPERCNPDQDKYPIEDLPFIKFIKPDTQPFRISS